MRACTMKGGFMVPYPILELGDIKIYMYGLMIAIGILCCFFVLFEYCKRLGISNEYVDFAFYTGLVAIIIGFIGSAAWQGLFNYIDDVKSGVSNPEFSLKGGITAIGGLATGALVYVIGCLSFKKKFPFSLTKTVTVAPCCMVIAHAFGRLGCLFAGCCHGELLSTTEYVFGGIWMQGSNEVWGYYVPTQLYESLFLFTLFGVLSYLVLAKNFKYSLAVYIGSYGIWRFVIEFFRADYRGSFVGALSPSQTQSLILIALAIPAFFIMRYFVKKHEEYLASHALADAEVSVVQPTDEKEEPIENKKTTDAE